MKKKLTTISNRMLVFLLVLFCGLTFYLHKFVPPYSSEYYKLKSKHTELKKERNKAFEALRKSPENVDLVQRYIFIKNKTDKVWDKYKIECASLKYMGFKTKHHFLAHFGLTCILLVYPLFNLFRSFYYEKRNLASRVFHMFVLSVGMFNLFWSLNTLQDLSNFEYFLATVLSAILLTIGIRLFTQYRQTRINELKGSIREISQFAMFNTLPNKQQEMFKILNSILKSK